MANFVQFLIGATLVLVFVSLTDVNSLPVDVTPTAINSIVIPEALIKKECFDDFSCGHGICLNATGKCECNRGYITHSNIIGKNGTCNYNQRSKQTAFFLSFFTGPFGIDWFYLSRSNLGYIIAGLLKLLLGCGCCGSWPFTYFGPEIQNSEAAKAKLRGVRTFFSLLSFAWWIVDWARILGNRFPDGNGAGLFPWLI